MTVEQCPPSDTTPNVYRIAPEAWVHDIYTHVAAEADPTIKEQRYLEARSAAFQILGHQAKRWSNAVDLDLPDPDNVRITITYLSPQLVEAILLNDMLAKREINYSDGDFTAKFWERLGRLVNRDEILFLFTITTLRSGGGVSNVPPTTIDIPIGDLTLTNSAHQTVHTKHDDNSLDQYNHLVDGYSSGIITYQMTAKSGESCSLFLDPLVNTTITIHLTGLMINDEAREQQTWTIRYASPLGETSLEEYPNYTVSNSAPNFEDYNRSQTAPDSINPQIPDPLFWEGYWEKMGCYIWEQLMFSGSP